MTHILKINIVFALISIKPIFIEGGLIITFGIVTGGIGIPTRKGWVTLCVK